jgi:hypothetical protein
MQFPNKVSMVGTYFASFDDWRTAGPGAFTYSWRDDPSKIDGLWWKDWWGGYHVDGHGNIVIQDPAYANRHILPFVGTMDNHPKWNWDGNILKPTITPSILVSDRYYRDPNRKEVWHGHLKAGVFVSC